MYRYTVSILTLSLCVLPAAQTQAKSGDSAALGKKAGVPTITVTKLDTSDKTLKLNYEIKNDSGQDIWVCENICATLDESDFEAYMADDKQTLLIRRRLDVTPIEPAAERVQPSGRYVRLRAGQSRDESLLLSLPVESRCLFASHSKPDEQCAKSLAVEIGYYPGDMPSIILPKNWTRG